MRLIGLDLSLNSTGVAILTDGERFTGRIRPGGDGPERLRRILTTLAGFCTERPDLAIIEDYPSQVRWQTHQMGEVHGVVKLWLYEQRIPFVRVNQTYLKGAMTGRGNAKKDEVFAEVIRRLGYQGSSNDEADALGLATMAQVAYGLPGAPELPQSHAKWVDKVKWPALL